MSAKPITVEREDYKVELIMLTNKTDLPAFVKLQVLREISEKLTEIEQQELQRDRELWAKEQDKAQSNEEQSEVR